MYKCRKMIAVTLAQVMILLIFATLPSGADVTLNPSPTPQDVVSESVASSPTTTTAVDINITDGEIRVEKGKTYRLVHDDFEVYCLSYFWNSLTVTGFDTIYTDTAGTTSIAVGYISEKTNTLTYTDCVVHIYDVAGTIDFSRDKIFVEKGKSYLVHANGYDFVTLVSNSTIISTTSTYMITANQTGTTNIWGQYFNGDNQYSIDGCMVDVFEAADIEYGTYFVGLYQEDYNRDNFKFLSCGYSTIAELHYVGAHDTFYQKIIIQPSVNEGGYYIQYYNKLLFPGMHYLAVQNNGEVIFSVEGSETPTLWTILVDQNSNVLIVPKGCETDSLVLSFEGSWPRPEQRVILTDYYETTKPRTWCLYPTTIRLNHYYDKSLQDNSTWDATILSLIPEANAFVRQVYQRQFIEIDIQMGQTPTAVSHAIADSPDCPSELDEPCNCTPKHHKDFTRVLQNLKSTAFPRGNNEISVLWADRAPYTYCDTDTVGNHSQLNVIAGTQGSNYNCCIAFANIAHSYIYASASMTKYRMGIALAHEIGHTLGIWSEPYNDAEHTEWNAGQYSCVMLKFDHFNAMTFYEQLADGFATPFCTICEEKLDSTIYGTLYHGNQ